ncbi:MAG: alpha/beta hydrolase [Alphaproteobacteria bacterium TMED89]|nr:hypothetical protein [Rhodospirillaceae bacterium]RPH17611.1 MAG: alpha/beta hydrolase [Alphaproteobacteria bacterium TMED89]
MSTSKGPFQLVLCPGAWCPASQWQGFVTAMQRSPTDISTITTAQWPVSGVASLSDHREAVLEAVPDGQGPVVLLGHSFGSLPMLEAAVVLEDRVKGAIFVDGFLPALGRSAFAQSEGRRGPQVMRAEAQAGSVPPPDPAIWGLRGQQAEAVAQAMQPHSLSSLETGISEQAAARVETLPKRAYIGASAHRGQANPFKRAFDSLEGRPDWFSVQINGGHLLHIERPTALAYWCAQFLAMVAGKVF